MGPGSSAPGGGAGGRRRAGADEALAQGHAAEGPGEGRAEHRSDTVGAEQAARARPLLAVLRKKRGSERGKKKNGVVLWCLRSKMSDLRHSRLLLIAPIIPMISRLPGRL